MGDSEPTNFLSSVSSFLKITVGDTIRCHDVKVKEYQGLPQLNSYKTRSRIMFRHFESDHLSGLGKLTIRRLPNSPANKRLTSTSLILGVADKTAAFEIMSSLSKEWILTGTPAVDGVESHETALGQLDEIFISLTIHLCNLIHIGQNFDYLSGERNISCENR